MLTPNHGCVGATNKLNGSDTVFTSNVFLYVDNRTTISYSFINSFMT